MKTNEMPERIYIFDYNDAMVTPMEGDTMYVREDAFIEKAVSYIQQHWIWNKKIIDDFRKYIEGEEA